MTESENQYLTKVGPGTPMGNLMRQYWLPVLQSTDLPEPDGAPVRVRLLCENLIAFRNTDGRVGLIDHICPHRCASLFFGRNEENGLRCLYHGWKFDVDGRCVDVPNEPPGSTFNELIRVTAYPCVEKNGVIWTYMGVNRNNPPPLPDLGWAMVGPQQRGALRYQRACNWLQAMEGDFDSSHLSFLHLAFDPKLQNTAGEKKAGIDYCRNLARMDKQPLLEVQETDVGVMYGARRDAEDGKFYWRVTQFMLPFYTSVPSFGGKNRDKVWVPLDDEHTMVWETHWSSTRKLTEEEQKGWKDRVGPSGFMPDTSEWLGQHRFTAQADNDFLQDRERQKNLNFSGMENVTPIQDGAMQESMGPVCDRTREHLGASDAAIVQMRRRLIGATRELAKQIIPAGVENPALYHKHGDQVLLHENESWVEHYTVKMKQDYAPFATEPALNTSSTLESITGRFAQVAKTFAGKVAINAPAGQWTFAKLAGHSDGIAAEILERAGEGSKPVALLMEHDAPLIAAILGTLKANKIYLALDPNHPAEQLAAMLAGSGATCMLTDQANLTLANSLASGKLEIFSVPEKFPSRSQHEKFPDVAGEAGAWLMYTSGSTSAPKGVWQNHRGIVQEADMYAGLANITPDDRVSLLTACGLAASGATLFAALLQGATLSLFSVRTQGIERLAGWLEQESITIFHSVPTVFRHLARAMQGKSALEKLRLVRLGGEPVLRGDVDLFRRLAPDNCRLIQSLSSTETGMICTLILDKKSPVPDGRVPAGRPVRGVEVFLVDEKNEPLKNGGEGRIAVRSARVRQGYWRQPELTAEKFPADPKNPGLRVFISNDLGRFLPDGMLEHLGRADQLVKIRGQRVDLSEVEAALLATELAQEAVVTAVEDEAGEKRLAAYIVPRNCADIPAQNFRQALRTQLPEHMIPNHFVPMQKLPVTAAGKVDRRALPPPPRGEPRSSVTRAERPRDIVETRVARVWKAVLKLPVIARTDDFFELGGTSLQAVEVVLHMEKTFGIALPPSTLVERSTIAKLAELLTDYVIIPSLRPLVTLREGGGGRPLFLFHSGQGDITTYGLLARRLPGRPVYGLQSVGMQGESLPMMSIEAMADKYMPEILEKDPTGPYLLGATCMGGMVAFEIARRLVKQGREVAFLAFFDVAYYIPRHKHPSRLERWYGPWRDLVRDGCRILRWSLIRKMGFGRSPRGLTMYRRFVSHMNSRAYRRYRPGYFPGHITMFNTLETKYNRGDPRLMMRQFTNTTQVISLTGVRANLFSIPMVDVLAQHLQKALEAAEAAATEKTETSSAAH